MPTPRITHGWSVTTSNQLIDFDCATHAGPYQATLRLGEYLPADFATEVARAMNAAHPGSGDAFTCAWSFSTLKFTIDNGSRSLTLLFNTGAGAASDAAGLLGFDGTADTASASGHTSTDTVGAEGSFFAAAGIYSWVPEDPVFTNSPVTAASDGTAATRLQRRARAVQHDTDGGLRETVFFGEDKLFRVQFRYVTNAGSAPTEQTHMERLLDWIQQGGPINYQPDSTSTNALRLVLANPGDLPNSFSWLTRDEIDYPELVFVQQLSRT